MRTCSVIMALLVMQIFFARETLAQNLYDTTHTKVFAEYLYNTKQYVFAAEEYRRLADSTYSFSLDYAFKSAECYEFAYEYDSAKTVFSNYILPHCCSHPKYYYDYLRILVRSGSYATAQEFCDSLQSPFIVKGANIKACLATINENPVDLSNPLLLPKTVELCRTDYDTKNMFVAVSLSAVLPGAGRIYCGYVREGILAMLRSGFDIAHVAYGFHKYGFKDPYPLFFCTLSACFYVGNIFGTVKSVKKYKSISKTNRDEKILDYIYGTLF